MQNPFLPGLPIGFPLLPVPDATGTLRWPSLDQAVRQTIRAILMTRPGEWLLQRQRGVGLGTYLQQPNGAETRRRLREAITREVGLMETRIKLDAVELVPSGERGEEITITIRYRIKRSGAPGTVSVTIRPGG
jgi:phage baseplate assembly protein W